MHPIHGIGLQRERARLFPPWVDENYKINVNYLRTAIIYLVILFITITFLSATTTSSLPSNQQSPYGVDIWFDRMPNVVSVRNHYFRVIIAVENTGNLRENVNVTFGVEFRENNSQSSWTVTLDPDETYREDFFITIPIDSQNSEQMSFTLKAYVEEDPAQKSELTALANIVAPFLHIDDIRIEIDDDKKIRIKVTISNIGDDATDDNQTQLWIYINDNRVDIINMSLSIYPDQMVEIFSSWFSLNNSQDGGVKIVTSQNGMSFIDNDNLIIVAEKTYSLEDNNDLWSKLKYAFPISIALIITILGIIIWRRKRDTLEWDESDY